MMDFYIHKNILGDQYHLKCSTEHQDEYVSQLPDNNKALIIGKNKFREFSQLYQIPYAQFPPKRYKQSFKELSSNIKLHHIPWKKCIPKDIYEESLNAFVNHFKQYLSQTEQTSSYFFNYYQQGNVIFDYIQPACVSSNEIFNKMGNTENTNMPTLGSFMPSKGFAPVPQYNRTESVTGRLKVKKGPDILHLRYNDRAIIKSRFGNQGSIISLDYKSLEPRILLAMQMKDNQVQQQLIPEDVYAKFMNDYAIKDINRDQIKNSVIKLLYGANEKKIAKELKSNDLVETICEYFGIYETRKCLYKQYKQNGGKYIENYYGRPMFCEGAAPYVLLNYYIQSTAVDVSLMGFSRMAKYIKKIGQHKQIIPIFILHDALILDVHKDAYQYVNNLMHIGSKNIPKFRDVKFYLTENIYEQSKRHIQKAPKRANK